MSALLALRGITVPLLTSNLSYAPLECLILNLGQLNAPSVHPITAVLTLLLTQSPVHKVLFQLPKAVDSVE